MKSLTFIILFLMLTGQLTAQNLCSDEYTRIHNLQMESHSVINDESKTIFKRIRESKSLARKSLKLAYETIEEYECEKYSIIVDRIIELELQLGNPKKAELLALQRLNKKTPQWKSTKGRADASDLAILATISSYSKSNSFYKKVRKSKSLPGVCGTTTYEQDVANFSWKANKLFYKYGKIYCLKFLQASTIIINEDSEQAKLIWDNIYDLLIQSLEVDYSYDQIKEKYESSEIQQKDLKPWEYNFDKSQYFINLFGIIVHFKTISCPVEENKFKRCQPEDCSLLKIESELYKKIKEYAS